jgi:hypothetical protein
MKYEVVESSTGWLVRRDGVDLAQYGGQPEALADVAERLSEADEVQGSYSLAMRYQSRA